jgi:hypothetical protein
MAPIERIKPLITQLHEVHVRPILEGLAVDTLVAWQDPDCNFSEVLTYVKQIDGIRKG